MENKYDNPEFFSKYRQMARSQKGLAAAGEWHVLQKMLPDFNGKRVLDLGCGMGWHCLYAAEHGAEAVTGIDISEKMLTEARVKTKEQHLENIIDYRQMPLEEIDFPEDTFDIVLSSLAFHYIESFENICVKVKKCLRKGGSFVFSVEHPVFTAYGTQDWYYDDSGTILHWPVDRYYYEGRREAVFLGEKVVKYHKTLTTYINSLLQNGFQIKELIEPQPEKSMIEEIPGMADEMRRPMMLILSAVKA